MKKRYATAIPYWLLPLILFCFQLLISVESMHQIRGEELAESVRNVYWLEHRMIYDGISSAVGWYGTLLVTYKIAGFSLFTAKFVRLGLHFISLLCLAELLRRWMGTRNAWIPLLAAGLSPTLLYFNTMQTSYGMDLQYIPICLLLISSTRFEQTWTDILKTAACWSIAMIGNMSYPTFLFYIPSMIFLYIWQFKRHLMTLPRWWMMVHLLVGLAAFILPLALAVTYVKVPQLLLNDPTNNTGIFRGGGSLDINSLTFVGKSLWRSISDILICGNSYYFELARPDFSGTWTHVSLSLVLLTSTILFAVRKSLRPVIAAALLLLLMNLVIPNLSSGGLPGIRRCTGLLAALYALFAVVWKCLCENPTRHPWVQRIGISICLLIPLHHAIVYPANLSDSAAPSNFRYTLWFAVKDNPADSLRYWLKETENRRPLVCLDSQGNPFPCRYGEIFAALAGYRTWNGIKETPIKAYDWRRGQVITLSMRLWDEYYFPH